MHHPRWNAKSLRDKVAMFECRMFWLYFVAEQFILFTTHLFCTMFCFPFYFQRFWINKLDYARIIRVSLGHISQILFIFVPKNDPIINTI